MLDQVYLAPRVLETRKLGDIGILLTANERNLSITLRNDRPDFSEKVSPLLEAAKQNMEEIGYNVQSIQFAPLSEKKEEKSIVKETHPILTEKGYDITI